MSSRDETPTLRKNRPRVQTSEDRDLQYRQQPSSPGIPVPSEDQLDVTSPFDMFTEERPRRRHGDSVAELAHTFRDRDLRELVAVLAFELTEAKRKDETGRRNLEGQLKAFLDVQPGGPQFEEMSAIVTTLRNEMLELAPVRKGLRWLQASVVLIVLGIGGWLYARGGKETAIDMRIQALEKLADKLADRLDKLAERPDPKDLHP